jgi:hypothetical protein
MANYKFCGVEILLSFSCPNVFKGGVKEQDVERLKSRLNAYICWSLLIVKRDNSFPEPCAHGWTSILFAGKNPV